MSERTKPCERCSNNRCHFCGTPMKIEPQRRGAGGENISFWLATCGGACDWQFGELTEDEEAALVPSHPDPRCLSGLPDMLRETDKLGASAPFESWTPDARRAGSELAALLTKRLQQVEWLDGAVDCGHPGCPFKVKPRNGDLTHIDERDGNTCEIIELFEDGVLVPHKAILPGGVQ